jgi:hypothetical protein
MAEFRRRKSDDSDTSSESSPPGIEEIAAALPEAGSAAIAALLHLIRLMGAELVLAQPGCETERFEQAVRTKIEQFVSPTTNQTARDAGLAFARHLVEQVLTQIRAQAQVKRSLTPGQHTAHPQSPGATEAEPEMPRFLN